MDTFILSNCRTSSLCPGASFAMGNIYISRNRPCMPLSLSIAIYDKGGLICIFSVLGLLNFAGRYCFSTSTLFASLSRVIVGPLLVTGAKFPRDPWS
ncbi:hypothetical protein CDAR_190451 [Caerostris darwini]|uniref:Uncharacterized protein n=1 Tax=Caerostris darwini TaxID=1538125 RepID=A0AAV4MNA5_9ARAC|nr:hypothetical protein CDAR_190451 [Caerostris darwini]